MQIFTHPKGLDIMCSTINLKLYEVNLDLEFVHFVGVV
jgi:hypothetical protein